MNDISMRDAFFDEVYLTAIEDKNIAVISADMGAPSLDKFRKDLAAQFVNVGIAEQNMVNVATGLALEGKKVFIYAIMPFATLRCYEVIKVDLSLMNIPVTIVGVGAGFSYDDSGPTHHSTEDISAMRALPNMTVLSPSDSIMAAKFARMSCRISGPNYVRLDREVLPFIYSQDDNFDDGLCRLREGRELYIIATGNMVHRAIEVSDRLAENSIDAGVIDLYRIQPINDQLLLDFIKPVKRVVTLEEHVLNGGMGSAIAEVLVDNGQNIHLKRIGIKNRYYYVYGGRKNIQAVCSLDVDSVTIAILKWL
jgi:transketolase